MSFGRKLQRDAAKFAYKNRIKKNHIVKRSRRPFKQMWFELMDKKYGEKEHYIMCLNSNKKNDRFRMYIADRIRLIEIRKQRASKRQALNKN